MANWTRGSDVTKGVVFTAAPLGGSRQTNLSAAPSWHGAHESGVTNGVVPVTSVGCSRATDPSWNFHEVQISDSVCDRGTTACVQTVPTSQRANVTGPASDVKNVSAPNLRPPLPYSAHHHRNEFLMPGNMTNIVPNTPVYSLNAQNNTHNEGRINFNTHASNNVPNWNRSVDILKALHSAVPQHSDQVNDRNVRQALNVGRPIFDIYAVSSEDPNEDCYGNQNTNPILFYRSKPEETNSSCTCVPISIPRVSSWSFTRKPVATTQTVYANQPNFETTSEYTKNNMIKIQSADNIRKLQLIHASLPSTSGQIAFHDRANYPQNNNKTSSIYCQQMSPKEAICQQPRENNVALIQIPNQGVKNVLPNSAKNSVVHWTNSVENRVCCPETVLYGAVYGLKCLK